MEAIRPRMFVDLHCHTSASFDSLADPRAVVRAAAARGLTHVAITDHGTIDGALRARDAAPAGLDVLIGEEIRTQAGDLIAVFLQRAVPQRLPLGEAIAAVREQGGLVGIPHPFDRRRGSILGRSTLAPDQLAGEVDWIEAYNARVIGGSGNQRAAEYARAHDVPGVAASDAHSTLEVGVAYSVLDGDPSTPGGLLEALRSVEIVPGHASYVVRLVTPFAKLVHAAAAATNRTSALP